MKFHPTATPETRSRKRSLGSRQARSRRIPRSAACMTGSTRGRGSAAGARRIRSVRLSDFGDADILGSMSFGDISAADAEEAAARRRPAVRPRDPLRRSRQRHGDDDPDPAAGDVSDVQRIGSGTGHRADHVSAVPRPGTDSIAAGVLHGLAHVPPVPRARSGHREAVHVRRGKARSPAGTKADGQDSTGGCRPAVAAHRRR